jgi:hypothetical protein
VPLGKLVMLAGDGGHGKSTITYGIAADVSRGRPCLGLTYPAPPPADVLLINCEDDFEDTIVPRLAAAGADLKRIHRVDGVENAQGKPTPFNLACYLAMERTLAENRNIRLVVIDPCGAYIGRAGIDDHKDSELRSLLGPMTEIAAQADVTFLLVKHLNRNANAAAVHRVMGSAGYVNAVRMAFIVAPDKDDENKRLFLPLKANIAKKPVGRVFEIRPLTIDEQEGALCGYGDHLSEEDREALAGQLVRIAWIGETDTVADDALAKSREGKGQNKVEAARDWLKQFLARFAYPSLEVWQAGEKAGFSRQNLFEAKKLLPFIRAIKKGFERGCWWWGTGAPDSWTLRPEGSEGSEASEASPRAREEPAPSAKAETASGRVAARMEEVKGWLAEQLRQGPEPLHELRNAAEQAGFNSNLLYRAKDSLGIEEFESEKEKWWEFTSRDLAK